MSTIPKSKLLLLRGGICIWGSAPGVTAWHPEGGGDKHDYVTFFSVEPRGPYVNIQHGATTLWELLLIPSVHI